MNNDACATYKNEISRRSLATNITAGTAKHLQIAQRSIVYEQLYTWLSNYTQSYLLSSFEVSLDAQ